MSNEIFYDRAFSREILSLRVKCSNNNNNNNNTVITSNSSQSVACEWTGELRELEVRDDSFYLRFVSINLLTLSCVVD